MAKNIKRLKPRKIRLPYKFSAIKLANKWYVSLDEVESKLPVAIIKPGIDKNTALKTAKLLNRTLNAEQLISFK